MDKPVENLVVDSSAFIRNIKIETIGQRLFTVQEVVSEIKDKSTRQRLAVIPYELNFKVLCPEDIKFVSDFAKKTGDYLSLSATDLQLIALCYHLEKQFNNGDVSHLKLEPSFVTEIVSCARNIDKAKNILGFHSPKNHASANSANTSICESEEIIINSQLSEQGNSSSDDSSDESSSDGEGDWITPDNLNHILRQNGLAVDEHCDGGSVRVACLTTDFAMQVALPPPKGGKHACNPVTCADQTQPKNQLSRKARAKIDPLHPDYLARDSPFAYRDLTSKSAMLGLGCKIGRNNGMGNESGRGKKRGGKRR